MEYSEDLMGMFRDFGCMLLLSVMDVQKERRIWSSLLEGRHKLKGTVKRQLMTVSEELAQLWAPGEQDGSGDTGEYEGSQNVREMFQTALEEIFHFCLYSKGGKNRYLLPGRNSKAASSPDHPSGRDDGGKRRPGGFRYPVRCRKCFNGSFPVLKKSPAYGLREG